MQLTFKELRQCEREVDDVAAHSLSAFTPEYVGRLRAHIIEYHLRVKRGEIMQRDEAAANSPITGDAAIGC